MGGKVPLPDKRLPSSSIRLVGAWRPEKSWKKKKPAAGLWEQAPRENRPPTFVHHLALGSPPASTSLLLAVLSQFGLLRISGGFASWMLLSPPNSHPFHSIHFPFPLSFFVDPSTSGSVGEFCGQRGLAGQNPPIGSRG
jgi:hypothetical protein